MTGLTVIITVAVLVPVLAIAAGPSVATVLRVERDKRRTSAATELRARARGRDVHLTKAESEELIERAHRGEVAPMQPDDARSQAS